MDQGLAAVFGAAVGVIGSAMTGALTWAVTRTQLKTQLQADRQRWQLELRRETYLGLLTAVRTARGALATALDEMEISRADGQPHMAEAWRLLPSVEVARTAVHLEGPPEMAALATGLAEGLFALFRNAYAWRQGTDFDDPDLAAANRQARAGLVSAEKEFIAAAQQHLGIDGSSLIGR
ncbi:hypothetical protein [Streptomyces sp. MI02-7b]|uniref:hypothetical protein n=1 Tax=Streptomyces sp. MI02-7b TaxID=462941 RepID=UPI0029BB0E01|nr:hypothetical protein [Streptomyces sp. MI02-7b]MDX3077856.1 hypothetical protein [Streptomyces sp. MI02-7b]